MEANALLRELGSPAVRAMLFTPACLDSLVVEETLVPALCSGTTGEDSGAGGDAVSALLAQAFTTGPRSRQLVLGALGSLPEGCENKAQLHQRMLGPLLKALDEGTQVEKERLLFVLTGFGPVAAPALDRARPR